MHLASVQSHLLRFGLLPLLVLFLGAAATVTGYWHVRDQEHQRILQTFAELTHLKAQRIYLRVDGYERTLLDLRGLFIANTTVSEQQFVRYLDGVGVANRYSSLARIGYARLVTAENRAEIAAQLGPQSLRDWNVAGVDGPYLAVIYGYPSSREVRGANLNADPMRRETLDAARDSGQPRISQQLLLRFDSGNKSGFILYAPLYGNQVAPASVAQRRQALSGYLYMVFRTEDLIDSTIGNELGQQMALALYDGARPDPQALAYASGVAALAPPAGDGGYVSFEQLNVAGHRWTFRFVALPQFVNANRSRLPVAILIGGMLASGLAAALANAAARRMLAERRVRYLAFHDELTGLPNRASLRTDIEQALEDASPDTCVALLIVELVRFRDINYTLGHAIGDALLSQVGMRLARTAGRAKTARISNIQFGILLRDCTRHDADALAAHLLDAMEAPFPVEGINYELGAHAGIAVYPAHAADPDELMRYADVALNRARRSGRPYANYDPADNPYKPQRLALLGAFRKAVKDEQLLLYYQPKADLRTGAIIGGEALVRWQHPRFGLLSPDRFIALIEPTQLIQVLTRRMLEDAVRQCRAWREVGVALPLAVNLSTRNLTDPELPDMLRDITRKWDGDASWVDLEITESSLMEDPALSLRVLNQLHAMGHKLSVDDYGTGYSSLGYLMKLPVTTIKIDHSFTMKLLKDPDAGIIIKSTIELAHNMGMRVVAEGAANKEIWDELQRLDCDEAQGYYISPPLPARDFPAWLRRSSWHAELARR